VSQLIKLIERG